VDARGRDQDPQEQTQRARRDSGEKFVHDFVAAWTKVMNVDRFDVA
jgi:catalase (peroxidase I)